MDGTSQRVESSNQIVDRTEGVERFCPFIYKVENPITVTLLQALSLSLSVSSTQSGPLSLGCFNGGRLIAMQADFSTPPCAIDYLTDPSVCVTAGQGRGGRCVCVCLAGGELLYWGGTKAPPVDHFHQIPSSTHTPYCLRLTVEIDVVSSETSPRWLHVFKRKEYSRLRR